MHTTTFFVQFTEPTNQPFYFILPDLQGKAALSENLVK